MSALKDTNGGNAKSPASLKDLFSTQMLSELNNSVAYALDIASTIVDPHGTPLTERANHSRLCDIVRSTDEGSKNCQYSARILGERALQHENPYSSPCYSIGLIDAAAPIVVGGHHVGTWLIGQASGPDLNEHQVYQYAEIIGANPEEVREAYREMRHIPREAFEQKLAFLFSISQLLSQQAYATMTLSSMVGEHNPAAHTIADYCSELEELASKAGTRMVNLENTSNTDPVTCCYSRSYLEEMLPSEIARSRRYRHECSVLMADIDYFKRINDRYEHAGGDSILRDYVATLQDCIRQDVDWIARYGGEEFVIVLPETGFEEAYKAAERLRETVDADLYTLSCPLQTYLVSLTSSFGIASFNPDRDHGEQAHDLVRQADHHLYQAKREGRNAVYPVP